MLTCQPKKWWMWVESSILMEDRRRKHGGRSAKRESNHFLKVILPSAIHANQTVKTKLIVF